MSQSLKLTPDLHPGYRLRRLCGRGGFGEVWEAEKENGDMVALKFLPSARARGAAKELRSVQVLQERAHAHLIRIDRVWCAADFLIVAMELADGSLTDLLDVYRTDRGTALPPNHLLPLLTQAAEALDFLNNRQHLVHGQWVTIQHCDVKPHNLLMVGESLKLSDFGLTSTLTGRHQIHDRAGTPDYAAPEVFQGRLSDRTDQYALAVCYCVLRGGRLPFPDTPPDFRAGYSRPPPVLDMLAPAERPAVARALAVAPRERWPSSGEFVVELRKHAVAAAADIGVALPKTRREPRYATGTRVTCELLATLGNQNWPTDVHNLSLGGARLRITQPDCEFRPGRLLELEFTDRENGIRLQATLRLIQCTLLEGGDYEVGGAFLRPLNEELVTTLKKPIV
jgi:serine/threonine-protein kinase